jgi:transaldolase
MGVIDGVTHPSLSRAGKPTRDAIAEICEIVDGPISAEVIAVEKDGSCARAGSSRRFTGTSW